jgi:uncharacterized protein (DUF4415 family)
LKIISIDIATLIKQGKSVFNRLAKNGQSRAKNAVVRKGSKSALTNSQETLAVDGDVIEFFKAQGRDYQMKINQILRAYMEAQKAK